MRIATTHRLGVACLVAGIALGTAVELPRLASASPSTGSAEPHGDPTPSSPAPSPATDAPSPGSGSPTPTPQTTSFNPTSSASPSITATPCEGPISFVMEATHEVITAGNSPLLQGIASAVSGGAPNCQTTGGTVTLFERRYGESSYREVATTETDDEHRFRFTVRPLVQTTYQAHFRGGSSPAATVLIRVHRRIDFTATGPEFAGRLSPAEATIPVGLAYIDAAGRYRYLAQAVADVSGAFRIAPRLPRGTYTYVVYTSPRLGLLRGTRSVRFGS